LGIFEILLFLIIALIVIPPDDLPQVMRTAGKLMRELRLASNTVMREISSAIGDEQPYNLLPPRFDDPPPAVPPSAPAPAPQGFLAPSTADQPPGELVTPDAHPAAHGDTISNAQDAAPAPASQPASAAASSAVPGDTAPNAHDGSAAPRTAEQAEYTGPPAAKP